jgi:hypothetical protein
MNRSKKAPVVHKPPFDEESAIRFAEMAEGKGPQLKGKDDKEKRSANKPAKDAASERQPCSFMLKPETISLLQQEVVRKGKGADQIIDKLVAKHLGKH